MKKQSLSETTKQTVEVYLKLLGDHETKCLHRLILDQVERPLLQAIMKHNNGNQSRTAICLGMNRATLRSKLKRYAII